jgi:hypothetical protein
MHKKFQKFLRLGSRASITTAYFIFFGRLFEPNASCVNNIENVLKNRWNVLITNLVKHRQVQKKSL